MFWAFPYLLWQAFGHWSGFLVGVIVAVVLTAMFNSLFHRGDWKVASTVLPQSFQTIESQPQRHEMGLYQRGYQTEELYHAGTHLYLVEERQSPYEKMQVSYPEMPPME